MYIHEVNMHVYDEQFHNLIFYSRLLKTIILKLCCVDILSQYSLLVGSLMFFTICVDFKWATPNTFETEITLMHYIASQLSRIQYMNARKLHICMCAHSAYKQHSSCIHLCNICLHLCTTHVQYVRLSTSNIHRCLHT